MSYIRTKAIHILLILFSSIIFFTLAGCYKKTDSIEFKIGEILINVGDNLTLETVISPYDATNQDVEFISSDESITYIEGNTLYAVSEGTAKITARQNNINYGTCNITINSVLPDSIGFISQTIDLGIGRTTNLSVDFFPENTTDKSVIFESEDVSIAKVDGNTLSGIAEGTTVVTATHSSEITASCIVNITPVLLETLEISGVSSLELYSTKALSIVYYPDDINDKSFLWESSDPTILSIDEGIITANKIGVATITAIHTSGITATKEIEVTPVFAASVNISSESSNIIYSNESILLTAVILPENTADKTLTWSSDNPSIATVNKGKVKGVSPGTTTIKATSSNNIEATYSVTVKASTQTMKVTISSSCSGYNHVGNEWLSYYSINGSPVSSGSTISITRNSDISFYTEIIENDSIPDVGTASVSITINTEYFENGFTITQTISVRENRGRYSGNIATWTVEYKFSLT